MKLLSRFFLYTVLLNMYFAIDNTCHAEIVELAESDNESEYLEKLEDKENGLMNDRSKSSNKATLKVLMENSNYKDNINASLQKEAQRLRSEIKVEIKQQILQRQKAYAKTQKAESTEAVATISDNKSDISQRKQMRRFFKKVIRQRIRTEFERYMDGNMSELLANISKRRQDILLSYADDIEKNRQKLLKQKVDFAKIEKDYNKIQEKIQREVASDYEDNWKDYNKNDFQKMFEKEQKAQAKKLAKMLKKQEKIAKKQHKEQEKLSKKQAKKLEKMNKKREKELAKLAKKLEKELR